MTGMKFDLQLCLKFVKLNPYTQRKINHLNGFFFFEQGILGI